jgi:ATP-dependent helicase/nuclease subunit A
VVSARASEVDTTDLSPRSDTTTAPHERLARLIALHAGSLIGKERRANTGELLHPGHFMVLVRRRNAFVRALVKELKREDIDVAGVDRLDLLRELAIQDLLALARFALLPQDDLNLACLLKSPLVGLDEEALFDLAHGRKGHLWRALGSRRADSRFAVAHAPLSAWLARADFTTPFDFFAAALGPEGGGTLLNGWAAKPPIRSTSCRRARRIPARRDGSLQGFCAGLSGAADQARPDRTAVARFASPLARGGLRSKSSTA